MQRLERYRIVEICAPSRVLACGSELSAHASPLPWTQQAHSGTFPDDACAIRHCSGDVAEIRRAASSSYQTLSQFFPQHYLLHPRSPKLVCPDKKFCVACLPSFRPGRWLRGSGQALSLNFYKTRLRVRPAAPPPPFTHPLTPQGYLIYKSRSLCKFRGRGVRWAGLRALV